MNKEDRCFDLMSHGILQTTGKKQCVIRNEKRVFLPVLVCPICKVVGTIEFFTKQKKGDGFVN